MRTRLARRKQRSRIGKQQCDYKSRWQRNCASRRNHAMTRRRLLDMNRMTAQHRGSQRLRLTRACTHKSDSQAAAGQCPPRPQKRTFVSALSMSALCQKQTCAPSFLCGALRDRLESRAWPPGCRSMRWKKKCPLSAQLPVSASVVGRPHHKEDARRCPLWVISGHTDKSAPCPVYAQ